jgi:hypothetical protein
MSRLGIGGRKDTEQAVKWYEKVSSRVLGTEAKLTSRHPASATKKQVNECEPFLSQTPTSSPPRNTNRISITPLSGQEPMQPRGPVIEETDKTDVGIKLNERE